MVRLTAMLQNLAECRNLIDLLFFCNKACFCVNPRGFGATPRDADHRDLKLAPDAVRMAIASGLRLHKHANY